MLGSCAPWATWCGPCRKSFPKLEELSKQNAGRVVVVGISVDDTKDGVADWAKAQGASFPSELAQLASEPSPAKGKTEVASAPAAAPAPPAAEEPATEAAVPTNKKNPARGKPVAGKKGAAKKKKT